MGAHQKQTENDTLLWSHIALAYCYVATRFKRQTAEAAIDCALVQTEFEKVARFVRCRTSKCVWSEQNSEIRVPHAQ